MRFLAVWAVSGRETHTQQQFVLAFLCKDASTCCRTVTHHAVSTVAPAIGFRCTDHWVAYLQKITALAMR